MKIVSNVYRPYWYISGLYVYVMGGWLLVCTHVLLYADRKLKGKDWLTVYRRYEYIPMSSWFCAAWEPYIEQNSHILQRVIMFFHFSSSQKLYMMIQYIGNKVEGAVCQQNPRHFAHDTSVLPLHHLVVLICSLINAIVSFPRCYLFFVFQLHHV